MKIEIDADQFMELIRLASARSAYLKGIESTANDALNTAFAQGEQQALIKLCRNSIDNNEKVNLDEYQLGQY
ncbi:hypothetical protein ACLUXD_01885 [Loigolactobacillus coryniformis subsp. coryniformis]|uniref:hypothetical protein n=1 Tax=Loigolactobacillus coryniformis TaxID=1610 RepID=UPI003995B536